MRKQENSRKRLREFFGGLRKIEFECPALQGGVLYFREVRGLIRSVPPIALRAEMR